MGKYINAGPTLGQLNSKPQLWGGAGGEQTAMFLKFPQCSPQERPTVLGLPLICFCRWAGPPRKSGVQAGTEERRKEDTAQEAAPHSSLLTSQPGLTFCLAMSRNRVGREKKVLISVACLHRAFKTVRKPIFTHKQ